MTRNAGKNIGLNLAQVYFLSTPECLNKIAGKKMYEIDFMAQSY
jgi:hypothetical protein